MEKFRHCNPIAIRFQLKRLNDVGAIATGTIVHATVATDRRPFEHPSMGRNERCIGRHSGRLRCSRTSKRQGQAHISNGKFDALHSHNRLTSNAVNTATDSRECCVPFRTRLIDKKPVPRHLIGFFVAHISSRAAHSCLESHCSAAEAIFVHYPETRH